MFKPELNKLITDILNGQLKVAEDLNDVNLEGIAPINPDWDPRAQAESNAKLPEPGPRELAPMPTVDEGLPGKILDVTDAAKDKVAPIASDAMDMLRSFGRKAVRGIGLNPDRTLADSMESYLGNDLQRSPEVASTLDRNIQNLKEKQYDRNGFYARGRAAEAEDLRKGRNPNEPKFKDVINDTIADEDSLRQGANDATILDMLQQNAPRERFQEMGNILRDEREGNEQRYDSILGATSQARGPETLSQREKLRRAILKRITEGTPNQ